ncbi:hypothetical protein ACFFLM_04395 [Deinococcus oregonensis]|uniref:Uncharacterized protein n=1 Tax=Deinococcus oregonensis TaxID=1805970 RepID=A0ABV6AW24_9DEIO
MNITLSTGIEVQLQRVDLTGHLPLTLHEALSEPLALVGMQNAKEGSELLGGILNEEGRPEDPWPEELQAQMQAVRTADARLLVRGCVSPALPELLALYGGDLREADLGLGLDFALLLAAVKQLSGLRQSSPEALTEARLFLKELGSALDSMGKRYGCRPSELIGFPSEALERERLALDLGVYYWARGEDGKDEWWRKTKENVKPRRGDD